MIENTEVESAAKNLKHRKQETILERQSWKAYAPYPK
jgi:hypothetical protein